MAKATTKRKPAKKAAAKKTAVKKTADKDPDGEQRGRHRPPDERLRDIHRLRMTHASTRSIAR